MKKHMNKLLLLAAALLIALALTGCGGGNTINLNDYITITASGYDTMGYASYSFDTDAFYDDWGEIKLTSQAQKDEDFSWVTAFYDNYAELLYDEFIYGSLDQSGDLSNGDVVTFVWDIDEDDVEEYFKVNLKYSDISYTVDGLEEITSYDAFDGVSVTFSGYAPEGEASLSVSNSLLSSSAYSLSQSSGLSNGDVITVTISDSAANSLVSSDGVYPETLTKEFTVEGLASYATSLSDIPEEALEKMDSQARDNRAALIASDWDSEERTLESMELLGYYFLTPKEGYDSWYGRDENVIYLVYQMNVNQMGYTVSYYWYIKFYDGVILPDGTYSMDYSNYDTPSDSFWYTIDLTTPDGTSLGYGGYEDLDTLFNNQVTTQVENYTYESTVVEPATATETTTDKDAAE